MVIAAWTMPEVLDEQHGDQAAALLRRYFRIGGKGQPTFTGSMFERFDGGGKMHRMSSTASPPPIWSPSACSASTFPPRPHCGSSIPASTTSTTY
jgi:hypothetical protein